MAEISGLVIGAVGLASLFKTCVELFECFELGKNYAYDYQLACTKICLLRSRLSTWGSGLNVDKPGLENAVLRRQWNQEQEVVKQSLFGIKDIFENVAVLTQRYELAPAKPQSIGAVGSLRQRTTWAIRDRKKFDRFIDDLNFLIEHLEKVTSRLEPMRTATSASETRYENDTRSQRMDSRTTYTTSRSLNIDISQLSRAMTGHAFVGDQYIESGTGVMGNVGDIKQKRHLYAGSQTVVGNGFAVMGDVSQDVAVYLSTKDDSQLGALWSHDDFANADEAEEEHDSD